mmetsp:Transcript_30036/g.77909  ORF Transcript_30036/g.77909 Transcript_30036/m.77909 type:complete len:133 (+) Transcript_30036:40-438(+)
MAGFDDDDNDDDYGSLAPVGGGGRDTRSGGREAAPPKKGAEVAASRRLWVTRESRERWLASLHGASYTSAVGTAIVALRQHCRWFGVLPDVKGERKQTRADLTFQVHTWCHATALGSKQTPGAKTDKGKKGR